MIERLTTTCPHAGGSADAQRTEWKRVLEDPALLGQGRAVWEAVRDTGDVLHTPYGALVANNELVRDLLQNESTFSVRSYWARMAASLGGLHLGMDETVTPIAVQTGRDSDRAYERDVVSGQYVSWARPINDTIYELGQEDCVRMARECADALLWSLPPSQDEAEFARRYGLPARKVRAVDLTAFSLELIGRLAHDWFGLPGAADGSFAGTVRKFLIVSMFVFHPNPEPSLQQAAMKVGAELREQYARLPATEPLGRIARTSSEDPVRDAIGAALGLIGPTSGSFASVMTQWIASKELWRVQQLVLDERLPLEQRLAELERIILGTMQNAPVPGALHRTAVREDWAGGACPARFQVGERVVASITSAVRERAEPDLLFGGRYGSAARHACPGRDMAVKALIGMSFALLSKNDLRAIGPLALTFAE